MARMLVFGLVVVVALAAANVRFPKGPSSSKNWSFAFDHPTILLHIITGSIIVALAIGLFLRSAASRNRLWVVLSELGLAFVVLAWATGADYVATLSNGPLTGMSLGWLGAIVTYGVSWRLSRAAVLAQEKGP
jgi:hypothetical protein